jgi:hypothetical protein
MSKTRPCRCGQAAVCSTTILVFLRYAVALVVVPQSLIRGGFYLSRFSDLALDVAWWSCAVYCLPVVAIFGEGHFWTHAMPGPSDLAGHAILIAFYITLALAAATVDVFFVRCGRNAEPLAPHEPPPSLAAGESNGSGGRRSVS